MSTMQKAKPVSTFEVRAPMPGRFAEILAPRALAFLEVLVREFTPRRNELLRRRVERQARLDAGELPGFLEETRSIRESEWTVAPIRPDLLDRRGDLVFETDVSHTRQGVASRLFDRLARSKDCARKLWVRVSSLRHDGNVRAVPGGPESDGQPNAPARTGDEERLSAQIRHWIL